MIVKDRERLVLTTRGYLWFQESHDYATIICSLYLSRYILKSW